MSQYNYTCFIEWQDLKSNRRKYNADTIYLYVGRETWANKPIFHNT